MKIKLSKKELKAVLDLLDDYEEYFGHWNNKTTRTAKKLNNKLKKKLCNKRS